MTNCAPSCTMKAGGKAMASDDLFEPLEAPGILELDLAAFGRILDDAEDHWDHIDEVRLNYCYECQEWLGDAILRPNPKE